MPIERIEQIRNNTDRKLVGLLQDIVRIPSWIPDDPTLKSSQNENGVVDYLEDWVISNTDMKVTRQTLDGGRYNLILSNGKPDLVFLAHTDTVQPSLNSQYDQMAAEIHDGKIWGRGTTDMKSGIATMLQALSINGKNQNTWMFLYADEEYDFLGMKGLVNSPYGELKPKLLVSSDGSDLRFGHGCRGLIEFRAKVKGQTGHPARGTGNSAIWGSFEGLSELKDELNKHIHPVMGKSSFNLAYILGGALVPDSLSERGRLTRVGQAGNVVPDVAEFLVDIRPSSPDLNLKRIDEVLNSIFNEKGLSFEITERNHNLGAWYTDIDSLSTYLEIAKEVMGNPNIEIDNPAKSGYLDLQMYWDRVGRPPAFMFGGGEGDTAHTPNENISINNLIKTRNFFQKVLEYHNR